MFDFSLPRDMGEFGLVLLYLVIGVVIESVPVVALVIMMNLVFV